MHATLKLTIISDGKEAIFYVGSDGSTPVLASIRALIKMLSMVAEAPPEESSSSTQEVAP